MKFGPIPVKTAEGAILAHAVEVLGRRLRKATVLGAQDILDLQAAGVSEIIAAVVDPGDLDENAAAAIIAGYLDARCVEAKKAATGRVNIHARADGVFLVDRSLIDAINAIDPAITIATLAEYARVEAGQMVATVKIIPFAVAGALVERVGELARGRKAFSVEPFRPHRVEIIQTELPGVKGSVLAKTVRVTEQRLVRSGSEIIGERRTPHESAALAVELKAAALSSDMVLMFGASAVSDSDDVIPAAIRLAGGEVVRAGMPVDPGNLIVVGKLSGKPVLGAPGCARSPKENGFDWVLDRLIAGIDVGSDDIAAMGVGGLLMEIPSRPQPREPVSAGKIVVEAVVLAAGRSSRMGGPNKLLALFEGQPLICRTVDRALASRAAKTVVVSGHQEDRLAAALSGVNVQIVANRDYASGLASSLKAGINAVTASASGALILLGDMPEIQTGDLDRLIAAFVASGGKAIVRASHNGKRGNPVLLPRSVFPLVARLEGDTGARHIVESEAQLVVDVEIGKGAGIDVDTPEALSAAGGVLQD